MRIEMSSQGLAQVLLLDPTSNLGPGLSIPGVGGLLMVNAGSISFGFGPGNQFLPLSLVGVPPGIGLTFQSAALTSGGPQFSEARHFVVHG